MKKTVTLIKALAFILVVGGAQVNFVHAQNGNQIGNTVNDLPRISVESKLGSFSADFNGSQFSSSFVRDNLSKWLGGGSDDSFELVKTWTDELGITKTVYQHLYKNIKVADGLIVIHEKDDKVLSVNGEFVKVPNMNISNAVDAQNLKSIISASISGLTGNIELSDNENVIAKVVTEKNELKLYSATKVSAYSFSPLTSKVYYIDNSTKKIANSYSLIHHVDTPSVSATYYKGNQNITVDSNNGGYRLKNNAKKVWTVDASNMIMSDVNTIVTSTDGYKFMAKGDFTVNPPVLVDTYNTDYINSTPNFTSSATKTAVEVHWSIGASNDYYFTRLNRNSFDGLGTPIVNYNNFNFGTAANPSGTNATAITLGGARFMAFGNGQPPLFNPFVGIDVGGHEYSHLVVGTNGTGGLAYQAESGALNEAFADILGSSIEFFANPAQGNWTIGEGLVNPGSYTTTGPNPQTIVISTNYLRNMATPKSGSPYAGGQQPDTYNGQYWASTLPPYNSSNDQGGVHINSGVANKWYYLLSVGGSGTNDNGTNYSVQGITIQKAEKIAYKTLTGGYLTTNSNYLAAYTASKQAAIALYGAGSQELQQVENAWCAVGIGNCAILGLDETVKAELQGVKVYPNPVTNGQFTITSDLKKEASFDIYDASGRAIKQAEKLQKGDNKVNISGASAGVYLLKISADGQTTTKKLIVK